MQYILTVAGLALCLLGAGCVQGVINVPGGEDSDTSISLAKTSLDLSNQGLTQVSQDVFDKTNLVELDLSSNQLTGAIPGEIRQLIKLQVLDLSDNALTGVPAEVGQLKNLKVLDLSNNQITGLPLELGQLTGLETLDLRGNEYSVIDLENIRKNLTDTKILVD